MARTVYTVLATLVVSACASQWDMQGIDPKDYYAEHPVKNTIETQHMYYTMEFTVDRNRLSGDSIEDFQAAVRDIRPEAVETVTIGLAPSQMGNELRKQHITKILRGMGYNHRAVRFESTKALTGNKAELDIAYAVAIPPRCPDWRKSSVTNYSNTPATNFGCATAVNKGLMVADPRDLEKGSGENAPDADRNALVIRSYKSGQDFGPPGGSSSSSSSSSGEGASQSSTQ